MKLIKFLILTAFAGVLIYASFDLPHRGDPDNRMHAERSINDTPVAGNYYIQESYHDAHTPNFVTVVLGDYRSVDTLGEQVVIFTAGMICLLILRKFKGGDEQ
ncbi:MAG: hydrogen gas-evolving membrane-bound hydrogenase subunit E [Balneolaceae bacterium]